MLCPKCHSNMVEVIIAKIGDREHIGMVCPKCGRIISRDTMFKRVYKYE